MKVNLLNIDLELIPNNVIIDLAKGLGCDLKAPSRIRNKYSVYILDKLIEDQMEIDEDLFTAEKEENKIIEKKYRDDCNVYFNDVLCWLKNNGFLQHL